MTVSDTLHVGTDHCPVCELVDLNAKARSASPSGMSLADRAYAAVVKHVEDDRRRSTYTPLGNG